MRVRVVVERGGLVFGKRQRDVRRSFERQLCYGFGLLDNRAGHVRCHV